MISTYFWRSHVLYLLTGNCRRTRVYSWTQLRQKSFGPCYSQSPPPEDFTPHYGWTWDFYTPTAKSGWGLGIVYVISLFTFESSIVLLSYYTLFVNKYICFLYVETIIRNASKGGKSDRKIYHPWFQNFIQTQTTNEENSSLYINSIL